jgi:hypothetical protein
VQNLRRIAEKFGTGDEASSGDFSYKNVGATIGRPSNIEDFRILCGGYLFLA